MAGPPESGSWDSPAAWALRTRYRCQMCHKQCFVPCRFTAAEFLQMEQAMSDGGSPDDGLDPGDTEG